LKKEKNLPALVKESVKDKEFAKKLEEKLKKRV